jgi:hypothetical protein
MKTHSRKILDGTQTIDLIRKWKCEIHADRMVCHPELPPLPCDRDTVPNQVANQIDFSDLALQTIQSIPVIGTLFIKT